MRARFVTDDQSFRAVVQLGTSQEDLWLEFKQQVMLSHQNERERVKNQIEFCRDVSQFANAEGGCLVIGVSERRDPDGGPTVAGTIFGVSNVDVLIQQIEDTLGRFLVPSVFSRYVIPIVLDVGVIVAVNVPASYRPVVIWNGREGWSQCYRRSAFGKISLNPAEFEAFMMDNARSMRLRLASMMLDGPATVELHSEVWEELGHGNYGGADEQVPVSVVRAYKAEISSMGDSEFTLSVVRLQKQVSESKINIPYGFIDEAWLNQAGILTLSLERKVLFTMDGILRLERRSAHR